MSDVYVVGFNSSNLNVMDHFDGHQWQAVPLSTPPPSIYLQLKDIIGFENGKVVAVGSEYILKSNPHQRIDTTVIIISSGTGWTTIPIREYGALTSLGGTSGDDIWAVGTKGLLYHCDGTSWIRFDMDSRLDFRDVVSISATEAYLLGTRRVDTVSMANDYHVLFQYLGIHWNPIDSVYAGTMYPHFGESRIGRRGKQLVALGHVITSFSSGGWTVELGQASGALQALSAIAPNSALAVGQNSQVFYYDGVAWLSLDVGIDPDWWLTGVWMNEGGAYIIGNRNGRTIVIRGQ